MMGVEVIRYRAADAVKLRLSPRYAGFFRWIIRGADGPGEFGFWVDPV